jgi:hypothetical protein
MVWASWAPQGAARIKPAPISTKPIRSTSPRLYTGPAFLDAREHLTQRLRLALRRAARASSGLK